MVKTILENIHGYVIFGKLLQDSSKLIKIKDRDLCILMEIIFRLKDKLSKDTKYYISFDTLYHKLK